MPRLAERDAPVPDADAPVEEEAPAEEAPAEVEEGAAEEPAPPVDPVMAVLSRLEELQAQQFAAMEKRMELLALKAVETALPKAARDMAQAAALQAASKPPMTMRGSPADNFVSSGAKSPHLGHYRCERMRAVKIQEFDMRLMDQYKNGEIPWPTNTHGKRLNLLDLTRIQGANIPALDGHIYPTTENQVRCLLEHYKTLDQALGGMPDLYEDTSTVPFTCEVCQGSQETWSTREGYINHMLYVHGQVIAA